MFAARGFGDTSLRQLIAETGMSPTAFYARYRSKQAVLEALVERVLSKLLLSLSAALARATSVDDAVDVVAAALADAVIAHRSGVRLAMTEAPALPPIRRVLHGAYDGLARLVGSYLAKKRIPNAESAGWAMVGAFYLAVMRWAVFEELDDAGLAAELKTVTRVMRTIVR